MRRAIDQDFDGLIVRLEDRPLGGQHRKLVGAGVQVDGLAHVALALDEGDLRAGRGVLGLFPIGGEVAAVAGYAGPCGELPGRAAGGVGKGVCGQGRLLESSVGERVLHGRDGHFVDENGAVGAGRTRSQEFDAVRARRYREIPRLVGGIGNALGRVVDNDRAVGNDHALQCAVDQDLDPLILGLVVQTLRGEEGEIVDAGVEVDGLADAAIVLDEGDLRAVGGVGIAVGERAAVTAHAGVSRELPGRTGGRDLIGDPRELPGRSGGRKLVGAGRQFRRLETAVADAIERQGGGRQQFSAFETFYCQRPEAGTARRRAAAARPELRHDSLVDRSQHPFCSGSGLLVRQAAQRPTSQVALVPVRCLLKVAWLGPDRAVESSPGRFSRKVDADITLWPWSCQVVPSPDSPASQARENITSQRATMMATAPSRGNPEDSQEKQPECTSFEQAIGRLEEIVHSLEEGKLGLDEALGRYEEGVGLLRRAYELLETAQRRISLLSGVDSEGNPILRPMEDAASFTP